MGDRGEEEDDDDDDDDDDEGDDDDGDDDGLIQETPDGVPRHRGRRRFLLAPSMFI